MAAMPSHGPSARRGSSPVTRLLGAVLIVGCLLIPLGTETTLANECGPCPPIVSGALTTAEDALSEAIVIRPHESDGVTTHFLVTDIVGGTLYKGTGQEIKIGDYITKAEGAFGVRFLPDPDLNTPAGNEFQFTVRASIDMDEKTLSDETFASITVTEVNDPPKAGTDVIDMWEDVIHVIAIADLLQNDKAGPPNESGQELTLIQMSSGANVQITIVGDTLELTPDANFHGTFFTTYQVQDNGTTDGVADPKHHAATVGITVWPVADRPVVPVDLVVAEDTETDPITIARNPVDGNEVTSFVISGIKNGSVALASDGTPIADEDSISIAEAQHGVTFTPAADLHSASPDNPLEFGFTVQGRTIAIGPGESTDVRITVFAVNDPPIAVDDTLPAVRQGSGRLSIPLADVLANDSPGPANESAQSLQVTAVRDAVGGTVAIDAGNIVFTLTPDFTGEASFVYEVTDNGTSDGVADPQTSAATVTFDVTSRPRTVPGPPPVCLTGWCFPVTSPDEPSQFTTPILNMTIPAGAIAPAPGQTPYIVIASVAPGDVAAALATVSVPDNVRLLGRGFDLNVSGGTIAGPITLHIPLLPDELAPPSDPHKIGLFRLNNDGSMTFVGGKLVDGMLVVELHSFSRYVLADVSVSFRDIARHWAQTAAERLAAKYIVRGQPDGTLRPDATVTRAEFVTMLVRTLRLLPAPAPNPFAGTSADEIGAAIDTGLIVGRGAGELAAGEPVLRQEAAVMIARGLRLRGEAPGGTPTSASDVLSRFVDSMTVADWAAQDAADMIALGIMQGAPGDVLSPLRQLTRAEAVTMLYRLWQR